MSKPSILVVENDEHARMLYELMLELAGYHIFSIVNTDVEALELLNQSQALPDLIITEQYLRDSSPVAFLAVLRADPRYKAIPFVSLLAGWRDQIEQQLEEANLTLDPRAMINLRYGTKHIIGSIEYMLNQIP